jgi:hypothetical protein
MRRLWEVNYDDDDAEIRTFSAKTRIAACLHQIDSYLASHQA